MDDFENAYIVAIWDYGDSENGEDRTMGLSVCRGDNKQQPISNSEIIRLHAVLERAISQGLHYYVESDGDGPELASWAPKVEA